MLGLLLKKEWKEVFRVKINEGKKNFLATLMNIIILAMLLATFLYIFILLNKRFETYGVSLPLYIVSLFLVGLIQMIIHLPKLKKMVFNPDDKQIIDVLPVKRKTLILSKLIIFYFEEMISLFVLIAPLTIAYGVINKCEIIFYTIIIPLVLISSIFILTLSLILVFPYYCLVEKIKSKYLVQFGLIVILIGGFACLYKSILDVFISLINEDRLTFLFNESNANKLEAIASYLFPYNIIVSLYNGKIINIIFIVLVVVICLVVCYLISDKLYFLNIHFKENSIKEKKNCVTTQTKALIKKEYILMFRSTNYLFSYGSLLVLLPVFVSVVTLSMKPLITRLLGDIFFLPFVILFVTMFSAIINSFGGLFISREKNSISIIKMLPVSFKKQMNIKVGIAMVNAMASIIVTMIFLIVLKIVNFSSALAIFVISTLLVGVLLITLAKKDLNKPAYKDEENNLSTAIIYSIIIPVFLFVGSLFLTMQFGASKMFLILILVMLIILIALFISYNSTIDKNFRKLRVE